MITRLLTLPLLLTSLATAAPLRIGDVIITGNSTISNQSQFRAALGLGSAATSNATSFVAAANGTATNLTLNGTVTFGNNTQVRAALGIENGAAGWVNKASMLWDETNSQEAISIGDAEIYINGSDRQEFLRQQLGIQVSQTANGTTTWTSNATRDAFRASLALGSLATQNGTFGTAGAVNLSGNATQFLNGSGNWTQATTTNASALTSGTLAAARLPDLTLNMSGVLHNSPVTFTAGVGNATLANQSANIFLAGPSSGNATTPTFRTLTAADLTAGPGTTGNGSVVLSNNATLTGNVSATGNFTSQNNFAFQFGAGTSLNLANGILTRAGSFGWFGASEFNLNSSTAVSWNNDVYLSRTSAGNISLGTASGNANGTLTLANLTISNTTGNLTNNGSTTLGDATGDSLTINAGTITAPNASSVGATNIANVGTLDARYGRLAANQTWTGANTFNGTLSFGNNTQAREALQSGLSLIAAHGLNNDQVLKIFTTTDYGATVRQIAGSQILAGGNFVRDPNIIFLNGKFYVAATAAWIAPYFNIFVSDDLVNWTLLTRVNSPAGTITAWSPCFFTEPSDGSLSIIFSASATVNGSGFANANQLYRTTPTVSGNLTSWTTPTQVVVNGLGADSGNYFGVPVIKVGSTYNLFLIAGSPSTVRRATSSSLTGNFTANATTGLGSVDGIQSVIQLPNGNYRMLYAPVGAGSQAKYADSSDLTNWTEVGFVGGADGQSFGINNLSIFPLSANATKTVLALGEPVPARPVPSAAGTLGKKQYTTSSTAGSLAQQTAISITSLSGNGTTANATVSSTANLTSNMTLEIRGASDSAYNIEAPITVTSNTTFTYQTKVAISNGSPTGTISAYNFWVTLFDGPMTDDLVGTLSLTCSASGAVHTLLAAVTGGRFAINSSLISSWGSGRWVTHLRTSCDGTNVRIAARLPSLYSANHTLSAVFESTVGQPPQAAPIAPMSRGPYATSQVRWVRDNPLIVTGVTVPTPALSGGASAQNTYSIPGNNLPEWGDGSIAYDAPVVTTTFNHLAYPTGLILRNAAQGRGTQYLILDWFNGNTGSVSAGNSTATIKVEYLK